MYLLVCGTGGKNTDYVHNTSNLKENDSELLHFSDTLGTAFIETKQNTLNIKFFNLDNEEKNLNIKK